MRRVFGILVVGLVLMAASGAWAAVQLRYSPADSTLAQNGTARISIMVDEPIDLRTIEVFVDFDPAILSTVDGDAGALFTDSGYFLFKGFETTAPGSWHGYCVVMGAGDFITGPGELFYWEVAGISLGVSPVTTVSVALAAPDASVLDDVTLPPTSLTVVEPASGISDLPGIQGNLNIYPNPFNPRAEIRFELGSATTGRLGVFDSRGRQVAQLHEGFLPAGQSTFTWDGRGANGLPQPTGVYFFRMETPEGVSLAKGMLVK